MLPVECGRNIEEIHALSPEGLDELTAAYTVSMQGRIQNDLGAVALLYTVGAATHLAAMIQETGEGAKETLDDADRGLLKEVADPALGGGVTNLMERFGRQVEQLDEVAVEDSSAQSLQTLLGEAATAVRYSYNVGEELKGEAIFLYARKIEDLVPQEVLQESGDAPSEAALSSAEMTDILSGFGSAPEAGQMPQEERPDNLGLVLDIQLVATARLGRVEMPVGDILGLGPGSVVEVGHLVDDPIELLINNKLIARGDVVVVDEKFGLRITEVVSPQARIESLR
jgi:flagellar motor switch protein FliN